MSQKPSKVAMRERRCKEKQCTARDCEVSLPDPPIHPYDMVSNVSGHVVLNDENENSDEKVYGQAPPIECPFFDQELYLMCLRCPSMAMVEHPSEFGMESKIDCTLSGRVQLAVTVCRTCLLKTGSCGIGGEDETDLAHMMKLLCLSPHYIESTKLYTFLSSDRMMSPHVVTSRFGVAYIPVKCIMDNIDDRCTLKSASLSDHNYILSHLKGGFF
jgi:hypothetical protein